MPLPDPLRSPLSWLCFVVPAAGGLWADLWSKNVAFRELSGGLVTGPDGLTMINPTFGVTEFEYWPGYLHFVPHLNHGAVFGLGQGYRWIFLVVSVIAIGLLGYLFAKSEKRHVYQFLLGMLFAGVIGNLYDRAVFGCVRDMISALPSVMIREDVRIFPWIFNIADSLLCVGVGAMFVYNLFAKRRTSSIDADVRGKPQAA